MQRMSYFFQNFKRIFVLLFFLISPLILNAQKQKYSFEELENLSKDSIIKLAEKIIVAKDFKREYFDAASIKKIIRDSTKQITVTFRPSLMYLSRRHLILFYSYSKPFIRLLIPYY